MISSRLIKSACVGTMATGAYALQADASSQEDGSEPGVKESKTSGNSIFCCIRNAIFGRDTTRSSSASNPDLPDALKRPIKITLLGDAGNGKTSLASRWVHGDRYVNIHGDVTAACGYVRPTKEIVICGIPLKLEIWDTAGQEKYQSLGAAYFKGTDIPVFCYSDQQSLCRLELWGFEYFSQSGIDPSSGQPVFLLRLKSDLATADYDSQQAKAEAEEWHLCNFQHSPFHFFEVSAETGENCDSVLDTIVEEHIKYVDPQNVSKLMQGIRRH